MTDLLDTPAGIDAVPLEAWLTGHVPGIVAPFSYTPIAGGLSNLTFQVADSAGRQFVLRRPPLGNVLESAHDMGREFGIIGKLAATDVPVATPLAFCADVGVTGSPFYVMEFVEGSVLRSESDVEAVFPVEARRRVAVAFVDTLAALHGLDPDEVGLGGLGRKDGYVERQLRRWHKQWVTSQSRPIPQIDEVYRRLEARVPRAQRLSIVHGDYRLDNCVVAPDGSIRAVLDWELCTLGDPLADLGLLMSYWTDPGEAAAHRLTGSPTALAGFPDRTEIVALYAERTGADVSQLDFYVALGYWKLACIAEGIYARYSAGVMGADGAATEEFGLQVFTLADAALAATDGLA